MPAKRVRHPELGQGIVLFEHGSRISALYPRVGIKQRLASELRAIDENIGDGRLIARLQAECVEALNDRWGVFSPMRIDLLPHQMWVCQTVKREFPIRWLIADDVGLGKTVEAGLIISPLLASRQIDRVLIICPASLVHQWQQRLFTMFGWNFLDYDSADDFDGASYWERNHRVIASLHTLRTDAENRHRRLLEAPSWDLVMVDEAHHLHATEDGHASKGFRLMEQLVEAGKVTSQLFFTGTPHRGKDYGFYALLELLKPNEFDRNAPASSQVKHLKSVMIRNNKAVVTDMAGNRLFRGLHVHPRSFLYSDDEARFYDALESFIRDGRIYAHSLKDGQVRTRVQLLLCAMQKLAASSVAAMRHALEKRLASQAQKIGEQENIRNILKGLSEIDDLDDSRSGLEERLVQLETQVRVLANERPALEELIRLARCVSEETKIRGIVDFIAATFKEEKVLIFTEYKATQALLLDSLKKRFGVDGKATFINGEGRIAGVLTKEGRDWVVEREQATQDFNTGEARFLVATEAAGEGVDLQEKCHILIHADMPWNPMRMHQRVGRIYRYGQTHDVSVYYWINPKTKDGEIHALLQEKIVRINEAFRGAMDDPEDMALLVLGMESQGFYDSIFSEMPDGNRAGLREWFDDKTKTFGGGEAIRKVREICGNAIKFDYSTLSDSIPKLDLADLKPLIEAVLHVHGKQLSAVGEGFGFTTPSAWLAEREGGFKKQYEDLTFDRKAKVRKLERKLLGVGHSVIGQVLRDALSWDGLFAVVKGDFQWESLVVLRVWAGADAVNERLWPAIVGVVFELGRLRFLRDWEVLKALNVLQWVDPKSSEVSYDNRADTFGRKAVHHLAISADGKDLLKEVLDSREESHNDDIEVIGVLLSKDKPLKQ